MSTGTSKFVMIYFAGEKKGGPDNGTVGLGPQVADSDLIE